LCGDHLSASDEPIPIAHGGRNERDLIAFFFPLDHRPAQMGEGRLVSIADRLVFTEKAFVDLAFPRLGRHEIPEVAHLGLANTVDASETLLQAVGIPGEIVIDHQMGALEVDALPRRIRRYEDLL